MEENDIIAEEEEEIGRATTEGSLCRRRNTKSANLARKLYAGNALTRGTGGTAIYLGEAAVRWSVMTVTSPLASSVKTGIARFVKI